MLENEDGRSAGSADAIPFLKKEPLNIPLKIGGPA